MFSLFPKYIIGYRGLHFHMKIVMVMFVSCDLFKSVSMVCSLGY